MRGIIMVIMCNTQAETRGRKFTKSAEGERKVQGNTEMARNTKLMWIEREMQPY